MRRSDDSKPEIDRYTSVRNEKVYENKTVSSLLTWFFYPFFNPAQIFFSYLSPRKEGKGAKYVFFTSEVGKYYGE